MTKYRIIECQEAGVLSYEVHFEGKVGLWPVFIAWQFDKTFGTLSEAELYIDKLKDVYLNRKQRQIVIREYDI